ncbi:hypothetical protein KUV80_06540 [Fictibacillus nanhaiensis]|uniref:hypothetical protein n=1 Tax=Fictibacillus nanhaiensis TaxID=742169 RepID=UPI001C93ABE5|nr:hypothetical protein [Fictibacillus nanhaiensis]MBY6036301.1 hypothetical protein [Fictibacillus nanhaiensis]
MAGISSQSLRDYLVSLYINGKVITEVYLENSNQEPGTPDLTGVTVVEVTGNYVTFAQAGSAGAATMCVPFEKILLIEE